MRSIIIGLGIQGKKRLAVAGADVVATVDPLAAQANYPSVEQVPLDAYDAAFVCTPDSAKLELLRYLLKHGKHVLVEKPLFAEESRHLLELQHLAQRTKVACYTAYNHRFEPHLLRVKELLDRNTIGSIYCSRFFYGNGTARDVRQSPWRDRGLGVLPDLGSHLLDLAHFFFGPLRASFRSWSMHCFENKAFDNYLFGTPGRPAVTLEVSLLSWRNTFTLDIVGDLGSIHVNGLCKWGPSTITIRKRIFPSGKPEEEVQTIQSPDPTWVSEYHYFNQLCQTGGTNLANDIWINTVLSTLSSPTPEGLAA
jgi:scyllo-inositol 2-dehydrogenase (NADP+)